MSRRDMAGELRDAARVVREQLWLIAACALAGLIAGFAYAETEEPEYQSTAKVLLLQVDPNLAAVNPNIFQDPARERATDIELVRQLPVAEGAAERLGTDEPAGYLLGRISTSVQGDSNVLSIIATDDKPEGTAALANAFAESFVAFKRETENRQYQRALELVTQRIAELEGGDVSGIEAAELRRLRAQANNLRLLVSVPTGNTQVIEKASGVGTETGSGVGTSLLLGGLLGLLIGLAAAFLRDRLDPRIKSEAQLAGLLGGIPIIARIPAITRSPETKRAALERFHLLRTELEGAGVGNGGESLLITSAMPGEGKSSTAANLALAISQRGEAAILLEADVRNPELSRLSGITAPGMADVLRGQATIEAALQDAAVYEGQKDGPSLAAAGQVPFIPAGTTGDDHWQLFKEEPLRKFLGDLAPYSSLVVVDGPPLGMFSDMAVLARLVDRVILVVQIGKSSKRPLARLREQMAVAGLKPAGVVVLAAAVETDEYRRYAR